MKRFSPSSHKYARATCPDVSRTKKPLLGGGFVNVANSKQNMEYMAYSLNGTYRALVSVFSSRIMLTSGSEKPPRILMDRILLLPSAVPVIAHTRSIHFEVSIVLY